MKADLHMHTTLSDGRLTPLELLQRAKQNGVDIIAITDHDIVGNVEEIQTQAKQIGVQYIPGIELSTVTQNKSVHLLGYFTDNSYQNEAIRLYSKFIKEKRIERAKTMISLLAEHFDIHIDYDMVERHSRGIVARPHIAKAIHETYPEYSFDTIFKTMIGDHNKAYVPSAEMSTKDGIQFLKDNHCIVVLAHPVLLKPHIKDEVLGLPFDGLEAIYYRNTTEDEAFFKALAKEKGMIITAGSDYHGIENDTMHGDIGDRVITGEYLAAFLNKYNA